MLQCKLLHYTICPQKLDPWLAVVDAPVIFCKEQTTQYRGEKLKRLIHKLYYVYDWYPTPSLPKIKNEKI